MLSEFQILRRVLPYKRCVLGCAVLKILTFQGDETHPYCPKCGENLEAYSQKLNNDKLCPHVRLIYSDLASDIVYCHKDLDEKIIEAGGYELLHSSPWDFWLLAEEQEKLSYEEMTMVRLQNEHPVTIIMERFAEPSWFCMSVESIGFGCGPVFETVYVVYDLSV